MSTYGGQCLDPQGNVHQNCFVSDGGMVLFDVANPAALAWAQAFSSDGLGTPQGPVDQIPREVFLPGAFAPIYIDQYGQHRPSPYFVDEYGNNITPLMLDPGVKTIYLGDSPDMPADMGMIAASREYYTRYDDSLWKFFVKGTVQGGLFVGTALAAGAAVASVVGAGAVGDVAASSAIEAAPVGTEVAGTVAPELLAGPGAEEAAAISVGTDIAPAVTDAGAALDTTALVSEPAGAALDTSALVAEPAGAEAVAASDASALVAEPTAADVAASGAASSGSLFPAVSSGAVGSAVSAGVSKLIQAGIGLTKPPIAAPAHPVDTAPQSASNTNWLLIGGALLAAKLLLFS